MLVGEIQATPPIPLKNRDRRNFIMSLTKIEYTDNKTIIGAENLNAIQDAIVALEVEVAALKAAIEALPQMELDSESSTLTITGV